MTPLLLAALLAAALPPPPVLEDEDTRAPVVDDEDENEGRRVLNEEALAPSLLETPARRLAETDRPADPTDLNAGNLGATAAQVGVGLLSAAGMLAGAGGALFGSLLCLSSSVGPLAPLCGCVSGTVLLCLTPAAVALLETYVGDVLNDTDRSALLPAVAAYAAFALGLGVLAGSGIIAVGVGPLLGGLAPFLVLGVGVATGITIIALAPALVYPFLDEDGGDASAGSPEHSPLFFFGRSSNSDMIF